MKLRRLASGRSGVAAVEFAIGASFLAIALVGVYDFGRSSWHRMQVISAAHAGAAYAAAHGFSTNGIVTAILGATDFAALSATPAPERVCGCPDGVNGIAIVACGSACGHGGDAGTYVRVSASGSYTFVFPYPYVSQPVAMSTSVLARIQ